MSNANNPGYTKQIFPGLLGVQIANGTATAANKFLSFSFNFLTLRVLIMRHVVSAAHSQP